MIATIKHLLKSRPKTAAAVLVVIAVLTVGLLRDTSDTPTWHMVEFRGLDLEGREIETQKGTVFSVVRGSVEVPEVRTNPESRSIEIGYAVVPGIEGADGAPVVMLAGGPGGSHIRNIERSWVHARIELFRRIGDVVMVDLRGIHSSRPAFDLDGPADKFRVVRSREDGLALWRDVGAAGREKLLAEGFDLSGYTVLEAAADVMAVADALGYETVNLYGTSFGSHFAMTTARLFPERVERFLVTGVEGYDHTFDDGAEVLKAVREIAREAEGAWAGAFGARDPLEALQSLMAEAEENPDLAHGLRPHEIETSLLVDEYFDLGYYLSNRKGMRSWPAGVAKIMAGERAWRMFFARRLAGFYAGYGPSDAAVGLFDCASSISEERREALIARSPERFPSNVAWMEAFCSGWQISPLPPAFQAGEISPVPGLLLHGTYDTSTPFRNAVETQAHFPNAALVTVYGGSHNALVEALETEPDLGNQIVDWFGGGGAPEDIQLGPIDFDPAR